MAEDRCQSRLTASPSRILDDLIFQRRSIRKYTCDPLPDAWIEAVLQCAHQAPSPSNSQPVRFVRIASPHHIGNLKQSLADGHRRLTDKHEAMKAPVRLRNWINAYHRYSQFMFSAPVLLAVGVTAEATGFRSKLEAAGLVEENFKHQSDVDLTVGLALQGLLLKAHSLGMGSCILTAPLVFIEDVEKLLRLEKITIKCFVTLGIAAEQPQAPGRLPMHKVVQVI